MFQAGQADYANVHALWAVCTDAVLIPVGTRPQPVSVHFADWVTYLSQANRYLESLDPTQRLLAVAL